MVLPFFFYQASAVNIFSRIKKYSVSPEDFLGAKQKCSNTFSAFFQAFGQNPIDPLKVSFLLYKYLPYKTAFD